MGALTCYQHAKLRQEALVHGFWPAPVIPNQLELLLDSRREASFALKRCFCDMTGDCERGMRALGIRNLAIWRSLATLYLRHIAHPRNFVLSCIFNPKPDR
jgi:hypothetical protein